MATFNYDPTIQPVNPEISDDFGSFLNDVATSAIPNLGLLAARLSPDAFGRLRNEDGSFLTDNGNFPLRENRQVTSRQAEALVRERSARDQLDRDVRDSEGYQSFYSDIITSRIADATELEGRLNPDSFDRVRVGDNYLFDDSNFIVREERRVNDSQRSVLGATYELVRETNQVIASIDGTASFLADVTNGTIPNPARLRARLNPDAFGRVRNENDDFLTDGRGIRILEERRVNTDAQQFLIAQAELQEQTTSHIKQLGDAKSFTDDILNGTITSAAELRARLNPDRFGRITDNDGQFLTDRGIRILEERRVNQGQADELLALFTNCTQLDPANRIITGQLPSGTRPADVDAAVERRRRGALSPADLDLLNKQAVLVNDITKAFERATFAAEVADRVETDPADVQAVFECLRDFDVESVEDRDFAASLARLSYDARRTAFATRYFRRLNAATDRETITGLLQNLVDFSQSPFDEDAALARELGKFTYKKELAYTTQSLLRTLEGPYDARRIAALKDNLPMRASINGFDYADKLQELCQRITPIETEARNAAVAQELATIVDRFGSNSATNILELIDNLPEAEPGDGQLREQVLAFYRQYLLSRRATRAADYRTAFSFEVNALKSTIAPEYQFDEKLGSNAEALALLASLYTQAIHPLLQSLKGDRDEGNFMDFIKGGPLDSAGRDGYVINPTKLADQRPLTEIEQNYLESVRLLSHLNPGLISLIVTNPEICSVYLESYFKRLSQETFDNLQDGDYVPLLGIGLGPNGLAAAGELLRKRPDLAAQTLFIDDAELPGGPFGVPRGAAWGLNSANGTNSNMPVLPMEPGENEAQKVRAYGSPLRWLPGERLEGKDVRLGSINMSVDYLPTLDGFTDSRYPDNEDEATLLKLQTAMVARRLSLETSLLFVGSADDPDNPNRQRVLLSRRMPNGEERLLNLFTDGTLTSSGLGKRDYGFTLENSRAKTVLKADQRRERKAFPKLSDTLTGFKMLSNEEEDRPEPGEVIVIYGNGNSADTLLSNLGGLFSNGNRGLRKIKKIYVITDGKLSPRPRYAGNKDLFEREGRDGLVEFIQARVGDVSFVDPAKDDPDQQVMFYDTNGNPILKPDGTVLRGDNAIAATGFRQDLNRIFSSLIRTFPGDRRIPPSELKAVTLPTNPNVAVADTLVDAPNVLIVGTASRTGFDSNAKLNQLPEKARDALLRNGADNAVAIGFRAPDTQAAVRLWLESIESILPRNQKGQPAKPERTEIELVNNVTPGVVFKPQTAPRRVPTRRDIDADSTILSPLLLQQLADLRFTSAGKPSNQRVAFSATIGNDGALAIGSNTYSSRELANAVLGAVNDPFFAAYAQKASRARRGGSRQINIVLEIKRGRVNLKESYAQPA